MTTEAKVESEVPQERPLPDWQRNLINARRKALGLIDGGELQVAVLIDKLVEGGAERADAATALNWLAVDGKIELGWKGELRRVPKGEDVFIIEPDAD